MKTSTVNISLQNDLMAAIDATARAESRTRSELIREAARAYVQRRNRWTKIFAFAEHQGHQRRLKSADVDSAIAAYRKRAKHSA